MGTVGRKPVAPLTSGPFPDELVGVSSERSMMRLDVDLVTMLFWGDAESLILGARGSDGSVVCMVVFESG